MTFTSADEIIDMVSSCSMLSEFLERDVTTEHEVGFGIGETGTVYEFREGAWDALTFILPPSGRDVDGERALIHTHPSLDAVGSGGVTVSESDLDIGTHPAVGGMVVLSMEMFEVHWYGEAILFNDEGDAVDRKTFEIEADGTTDGPAKERWVENPTVVR